MEYDIWWKLCAEDGKLRYRWKKNAKNEKKYISVIDDGKEIARIVANNLKIMKISYKTAVDFKMCQKKI